MDSINASMRQGLISQDIPQIKLQAVRALDTNYETTEDALTGIGNTLRHFYDKNYPGFIKKNQKKWLLAVQEIQSIYKRTIFPEMKAKWSVYPDNIGHKDWSGCFRCHNERMKSADERVLFNNCNDCHLILAQGKNINKSTANFIDGLPFYHPGTEEHYEEFTDCNECHDGGKEIYE